MPGQPHAPWRAALLKFCRCGRDLGNHITVSMYYNRQPRHDNRYFTPSGKLDAGCGGFGGTVVGQQRRYLCKIQELEIQPALHAG